MQIPANPMFHRHLTLAYAFTWALQLSYLTYVLIKRGSAGRFTRL